MSLYGWIWRTLPGPMAVKVALASAIVLLVVAALFGWVFPAVAPLLPVADNTVGR